MIPKGTYTDLMRDHASEVLGEEPKSERLREYREQQAREEAERREREGVQGQDVVKTGHLTPTSFLEATREPLPQGALTPAQERLWRHVWEGVASVVAGQAGHQMAAQDREEPFAGVGHALAALLYFRVDGPPMKSISDPDRFTAVRSPGKPPSGDVAQRLAEHLAPVESAWRRAYSGPWDEGIASERDCRLWLLCRYVYGWGPGQIDNVAHLEPYGFTVGGKVIGRVTRYGHDRVLEYLADRDLVPARKRKPKEDATLPVDTDSDLFTWNEIADVLNVHPDTAARWARERGMPVRRFGGRIEANREELLAWKRANTEAV